MESKKSKKKVHSLSKRVKENIRRNNYYFIKLNEFYAFLYSEIKNDFFLFDDLSPTARYCLICDSRKVNFEKKNLDSCLNHLIKDHGVEVVDKASEEARHKIDFLKLFTVHNLHSGGMLYCLYY